jgi:hypothetical protein
MTLSVWDLETRLGRSSVSRSIADIRFHSCGCPLRMLKDDICTMARHNEYGGFDEDFVGEIKDTKNKQTETQLQYC